MTHHVKCIMEDADIEVEYFKDLHPVFEVQTKAVIPDWFKLGKDDMNIDVSLTIRDADGNACPICGNTVILKKGNYSAEINVVKTVPVIEELGIGLLLVTLNLIFLYKFI